ncbi:MAG: Ger(x)C family spore germination protein [Clostridia bacterium]|nr:Ger(x)C family spore germination protein [Clostridia bacterium]
MKKAVLLLGVSLILVLFLSGCYDAEEVDGNAYIVAIGLDKGEKQPLRLTLQYRNISSTDGGKKEEGSGGKNGPKNEDDKKKGKQEGMIISTVECQTFFQGLQLLNKGTERRLNVTHAKMIIFSEELAKEGIGKHLATIMRYEEIRSVTKVLVTKEKAREFMEVNEPTLGAAPAKSLELLLKQTEYLSSYPMVSLYDLYVDIKNTYYQPLLPYASVNDLNMEGKGPPPEGSDLGYLPGEVPRTGGSERAVMGSAVFDGDRMMGALNVDETRVVLAIRHEFKRAYFSMKDPLAPGKYVVLDVHSKRKPKIKVDTTGAVPQIFCSVTLEANINSIQSGYHYETEQEKKILEKAFTDWFKPLMDKTIQKCRVEYKADVFRFGTYGVWGFLTIKEWEDYNWIEQFTKAKVTTEVSLDIRRSGTLMKSSPILSVERGRE